MTRFSYFILSITTLLALLLATTLFHVNQSDHKRYLSLTSNSVSKEEDSIAQTVQQIRKGVRKDIFLPKATTRLHLQLESRRAELIVINEHNRSQLIEKLFDTRVWIQERLYHHASPVPFPMQAVRYLEAKEATCFYNNQLFSAQNVSLTHYTAPGHELLPSQLKTLTPTMRGTAKKATFNFKNSSSFEFHAQQLRASLQPEGLSS